jgi:histidyl-tRNA synthetase
MLLATPPAPPVPIALVPVGAAAEDAAIAVLQSLRAAGLRTEMEYRGNLKRRMERANKLGARIAVILGETELARGVAQVKDLASGTQHEIALADLPARLAAISAEGGINQA